MAGHVAKAALYDALAESAKALANGRRAELVDVLAQGERSVEELADEIDQTVANTSQHLQRLLRSGLVESRREGTRIYYSLSGPVVGDLWRIMRRAAQEHVEGLQLLAADYLGDRRKLRTITRDDLAARLRAARDQVARRGEIQERNRVLLEKMRIDPKRHKFVRIPREDLGIPGCGAYEVRPRMGIVGMFMGWWQVKLSSGCPLGVPPRPRGRGGGPPGRLIT